MEATVVNQESTRQRLDVDWTNVRLVYKKLQTNFHMLTSPFGIQIPPDRNRDLSNLICAIDVVDRQLDCLSTPKERHHFIVAILNFLRSNTTCLKIESGDDELSSRLATLREIIIRLDIQAPFCDCVQRVVNHGEAKRVATNQKQMIHHLVEEWRLTGCLPVLFLKDLSNSKFEKFFYVCCATMPAIDMIQDAREDFRVGQISVRPTLGLYGSLVCHLLIPAPRLIWLFPKPITLFRYALSFIFMKH